MSKLNNLVKTDIRYFLAFGFGAGLSPIAPGTCGTLAAIPIYILLSMIHWSFYLFFVVFAFLTGVVICREITAELKINDYPGIVWDEVVGFWVAMFLAPCGLIYFVLGVVFFRLFDILKPFPIKKIEKCAHSGFAIMFDDVVAGVYALIVLQLINLWWKL